MFTLTLTFLLSLPISATATPEARPLFVGSSQVLEPSDAPVLRQTTKVIDLRSFENGNALWVELNLFDDLKIMARRFRLEWQNIDSYVWYGKADDNPYRDVVMQITPNGLTGQIFYRNRIIRIEKIRDDLYSIKEINGLIPAGDISDGVTPPETGSEKPGGEGAAAGFATNDSSVVDIAIVYTPALVAQIPAIADYIRLAVNAMNQALISSQASMSVRAVYIGQVSYTESGSINTDLTRITTANDGYADEAHTLRAKYGADLVSLWTYMPSYTGTVGLAYVLNTSASSNFGFSVVGANPNFTYDSPRVFSHEVGHNLGAQHDRANANTAGAFSYSYGYYNASAGFGTIMSYLGFSIMYYSNPLISYQGTPTGIDQASASSADNARNLSNMAATVAAFRASVIPTAATQSDKVVIDGCFIATAAYGWEFSSEVRALRKFRDQVLLRSYVGKQMVQVYYKISPPLARWIGETPARRAFARWMLRPWVWLARWWTA